MVRDTQDRSPILITVQLDRHIILVLVQSTSVAVSAECSCMSAMTAGFGWRQKLYGDRRAIKNLHHRHKQYLRDQGGSTLLRQPVPDDSAPELVHEYEAGPRSCHHGYWYSQVALAT